MKKLIALACAAVFAMFAGVEFVLPKDDEFYFNPATGTGDYFQVEIASSDVDYQSLYGQVHGFNWGGQEMCDTTQRQDSRDSWKSLGDDGAISAAFGNAALSGLYEPVQTGDGATVETLASGGVKYTITTDGDVNICAPASGKINTSHYACNYGSYMEYIISLSDGNTFVVTIEGAKCWYCCAGKSKPEDGRYTATTNDSLKGKAMRTGDVLCVGKSGTTIIITKAST